MRTFALLALLGSLAALLGERTGSAWLVPIGLAAVAAMLVVANATDPAPEDPGTTTVAAACVTYLLGALAGLGEAAIAGALGIAVTALLYFKPEIHGITRALERHEQVSVLQFLVASFIVLPILPGEAYGPYAVLNPRNIWLMVVLISGLGLASHVALRLTGERHGALVAGLLGGLVSSTATTALYAQRSRESPALVRLAGVVVPLANLVPLARIAVICGVVAPALLGELAPMLGAALGTGIAVTALFFRRFDAGVDSPVPRSRNPAQLGTAVQFAALYALVLFASAALSDFFGSRGFFASAAAAGLVDVDPIVLSSLNLFGAERLEARHAVAAIGIAYAANVVFKLGIAFWYDRSLGTRVLGPMLATVAGGAAAYFGG